MAAREDREATERTDVLRDEEVGRARAYGRATAILALLGLIVSMFRQLSLRDRVIVDIPVLLLGVTGAAVWWRSRDAKTYSVALARLFGITSCLCAMALIYKLGVFTPIVIIVVIGLAFFVNTTDHRFALVVTATFIAAFAVLALLTAFGVLPDAGVWRTPKLQQRISMTVICTAVMLTQVIVSLSNRRTLHEAIVRAQDAMRVARTREAQLDEARENLDVALRGPNAGRYTAQTLGGYRLGNVVGRGAMGEVYAARALDGGRRAAVKVLHAFADDSIIERFIREAEIARKAVGPNLIEMYDSGVAPDGSPFLVMELLEGSDLAAILRERIHLTVAEVVALVDACARGLDILHKSGVIHRDLKPPNIFLPSSTMKEWKILDYGVSKVIDAGTITQGDIIGTPGYMSPEQAEGKEIDVTTDIFALGAVAYRALTGRRPFSGADMPAILYQVVHATPARVRDILPGLPRRLDDVLAKALAKNPSDRYASALEFAIAFREASEPRSDDKLSAATISPLRQGSSPTLTMPGPGDR